jgi:hypothetical protein
VLAAGTRRAGAGSLDLWTAVAAIEALALAVIARFVWVELARGRGQVWSLWVPGIAAALLVLAWATGVVRSWTTQLSVAEQVASACGGSQPAERLRPLPAGLAYRRLPAEFERQRLAHVPRDFRRAAITRDVVRGEHAIGRVTIIPTWNPRPYIRRAVHHVNTTGLATRLGPVEIEVGGRKWTEFDRFHSYRYMTGIGCHLIDLISAEDDDAQRIATALARN